jgi:hypothetical protein
LIHQQGLLVGKEAMKDYSTEALEAVKASTGVMSTADRNAAPYLLKLETEDQRKRAVADAHTRMNLMGFRYSEAVWHSVSDLLRNIEAGDEAKPLYGEATAKKYRDAENERRKLERGY